MRGGGADCASCSHQGARRERGGDVPARMLDVQCQRRLRGDHEGAAATLVQSNSSIQGGHTQTPPGPRWLLNSIHQLCPKAMDCHRKSSENQTAQTPSSSAARVTKYNVIPSHRYSQRRQTVRSFYFNCLGTPVSPAPWELPSPARRTRPQERLPSLLL